MTTHILLHLFYPKLPPSPVSPDWSKPKLFLFCFYFRLTFRNHSFSEYTRAWSTWTAELQFSIPATSLHGQTPVQKWRSQWFWATLFCLLPACKKVRENTRWVLRSLFPSTHRGANRHQSLVPSALRVGDFLLLGTILPPWGWGVNAPSIILC